uniref:DUF7730 domain-containing protein n=1 Tax=Mycena chlorophos TaxID=658473 RepID=A0ABQ0KXP8_MYCCL|nr:predicted protein [Mycena chlorophos]
MKAQAQWPAFTGIANSISQLVGLGNADAKGSQWNSVSRPTRIDLSRSPALEQPTTPLSLFSLPPELRYCIYEQALGLRDIHLFLHNAVRSPAHRRILRVRSRNGTVPGTAIALLRTCRQVYLEAYRIPLEGNALHVEANELQLRLGPLRRVARAMVAHLQPRHHLRTVSRLLTMNLQSLVICFDDKHAPMNSQKARLVEYDPRMLVGEPWAQTVRRISTLKAFRIEFAVRGSVVQTDDSRWEALENDMLQRMLGRGLTPA